tara:strand:- start:672 stop:1064 length:393 start_codon:yes stop_codon:yes gene_type:complete
MTKLTSKKQLRNFGYLIGIGLPFMLGWLIPLIIGHGLRIWTFWVGLPFLLIGIISPKILQIPYELWMKLGHLLGWLNSRIILGIVFLTVLQPISLVMRVFGYDPLFLKKLNLSSYKENKKGSIIDYKRIF